MRTGMNWVEACVNGMSSPLRHILLADDAALVVDSGETLPWLVSEYQFGV